MGPYTGPMAVRRHIATDRAFVSCAAFCEAFDEELHGMTTWSSFENEALPQKP